MDKGMVKKRKEKCIITFGRSWNAVAATRCLGQHGVDVITGDSYYVAASNFSLYSKGFFRYPDPDEDPEGFINKLVEECEKYSAPDTDLVLMPLHTCAFSVAAHKERFDGIAKLALPEKSQIDLIGNKASLAKYCQANGFPIPETVVIDRVEDFPAIAEAFKYPAFLKIPDSNAAIGLHKVESAAEAIEKFNQDVVHFRLSGPGLAIIQEAVPGEDYCSTFLFEHGQLRASMTYHNILDYPRKNGMGALRETVDATEIEKIGGRLLESVGWHGVAEIDFRWDGQHTPRLIEVNPRFWGGLGQSIESGWDYPYLVFRLAVDGHIDPVKPQTRDVKTFNPCLITLLMLQEFSESKNTHHEFSDAFKKFHRELKVNQLGAVMRLVNNLTHAVNPTDRFKAVEQVIKENKGAVDELFKWKDPLPLLGLLYPLAVFIKKGKISPELLVTGARKS